MLKGLFIGWMALAGVANAVTYKETTSVNQDVTAGGIFNLTTAATYALTGATPTVLSSLVDLGSVPGIYFTVTGTATLIDVLWSNTPTAATFVKQQTIQNTGSDFLNKHGRYVKFRVTPGQISYTASSLFYVLADTPVSTDTANPTSPTASLLSAYLTVSDTVRTVSSSDVPLALTSLAGSATGMYRFEISTLGPCAGLYWGSNGVNAAPPAYHYAAASATALADVDLAAGEHLHLLRGSGADCTTKVVIKKRTPQAP